MFNREDATRLLAAIVESSDAAIIGKRLDGTVTSWNKAAERMFGYTAAEMIGRPIFIIAAPDREDEMPLILERIRRGEHVQQYETVRKAKDGRLLNVSLAVSPIYNDAGQVVGASKIARDITDQKRMEEALIRQSELIARSNADLREFAYITSHHLQEPLRTITTYGELLRRRYDGQLGTDGEEFIRYMTGAATRMSELVADLHSYTHLDDFDARTPRASEPRDVIELLVSTSLKTAIDDSGATIEMRDLPRVKVERAHLALLFENLISNAIDFRAQQRPIVRIEGRMQEGEAVFSVSDNGVGIAEQYHKQIFGVFKRLHGFEKRGTGMGLAICRRIVERYGGRIWVESKEGEGSTFRFTLPAA